MTGTALINCWGGGQVLVSITPSKFPLEKCSKTRMLNAVNDGQFGCESIEEAEIDVFSVWSNGGKEFERTIIINHPIHTAQFNKRHGI